MRSLGALLIALLMVGFGFGVYTFLGHTRHQAVPTKVVSKPPRKIPFSLPGTIYTVSGGQLYRLQGGVFTALGPPADWSQPALTPNGQNLVVVKRFGNSSDLYLLSTSGQVQRRLTSDASNLGVPFNLWAFYPRVTPNGSTIFFSTDRGKNPYVYQVDLAVWSMSIDGGAMRQWTTPNGGTGGDVQPDPLPQGGFIYTKFGIDSSGANVSTINLRQSFYSSEVQLTQPEQHCQQPAVNPDGTRIAMICQTSARVDTLEVWQFNGQALIGSPLIVFQQGLAGAPAWSPDGTGLVFFAPGASDSAGKFQLWYAPLYGVPRELTTGSDFDAISPPVWAG